MNIAICIPSPTFLSPQFALDSLPSVISYTKKNLKNLGEITVLWQSGVRTDRNRNVMLKRLLGHTVKWDYILWLDADMVYPEDILVKYFEKKTIDIMGCLYFKKVAPFAPVGYIKGNNPIKPFKILNPHMLKDNLIYEVDGIGYGGMLVNMKVYKQMGEDRWTKYGDDFHLPFNTDDHLTHDLEFCRNVQKHGFKVHLHSGVRPKHIGTIMVGEEHYTSMNPNLVKGKKYYTSDWLTEHLSIWYEVIRPEKNVKKILEIGCYEGRSTGWFLENFPDATVEVIDDFSASGYLLNKRSFEFFKHNIKQYQKRVIINLGKSQKILPLLKDKYDIIYVDGAHDYESVKIDIIYSWKLLREGGIIIFDDYRWKREGIDGRPKEAIDDFLENTGNLEVLSKEKQVIVRKIKHEK